MEKPTVILEKERDFTDLINATFAFIGQEFKMLFKVIFFYAGIFIIAGAILQASYTGNTIYEYLQIYRSAIDGSSTTAYNPTPNIPIMLSMYAVSLLSNFFICG